MELAQWIFPALAVLASYTVLGIAGFGSALILVPLLAWKWPLPEVVAMAILLDVPASMLHGGLNLKQVRWTAIRDMLPGMAVGVLLGLWLLGQTQARWPLLILGMYVVAVGLRLLFQNNQQMSQSISSLCYHVCSALVGVIEVMFATAGPVILAMLQRRLSAIADIRATAPVVMVMAGSIAIAMLLGSGKIDGGSIMQRWLLVLPIAGLGVALGNGVAKHINQALMRRLMAGLLVLSGLMLAGRFLVERFSLL